MTSYHISRREIRQIIKTSGLAHAEKCLDQAASQIGKSRLAAAYDELNTANCEFCAA